MINYAINQDAELVKIPARVRNQYNYSELIDEVYEHPKGVSLTVPDQALSMRDLLTRYTRGQDVPTHELTYDGEHDLPDIERMDRLEILDMKANVAETIVQSQTNLQSIQNKILKTTERLKGEQAPSDNK